MGWTDAARRKAVQHRVRVRAERQQDHDEQVRPYLELAGWLGLRGDGIVEFLQAHDVQAPGGGGAWSRQAVRRICHRLGLA